jgi:hypothetical protein
MQDLSIYDAYIPLANSLMNFASGRFKSRQLKPAKTGNFFRFLVWHPGGAFPYSDFLFAAPMADHFAEHFSSEIQLFERNPFIYRVRLLNAAWAKNDLLIQLCKNPGIGPK